MNPSEIPMFDFLDFIRIFQGELIKFFTENDSGYDYFDSFEEGDEHVNLRFFPDRLVRVTLSRKIFQGNGTQFVFRDPVF